MNRIPKGLLVVLLALGTPAWALDFAGLQAAVKTAPAGTTVVVPAGEYQGRLVVDRLVHLRGEPGARLVHQPGAAGPTLWVKAQGATITGFRLEGSDEGTRDRGVLVVTAADVVLRQLVIAGAWSGVLAKGADRLTIDTLSVQGLGKLPFWQRGEAVKVVGSRDVVLSDLDLSVTGDGLLLENTTGARVSRVRVSQARYGVHIMFGSGGSLDGVRTSGTVAGLMAMETSGWAVIGSRFSEGYRTGSAGIREVRTKQLRVTGTTVNHQATGVELIDAREGLFSGNRLEENAAAWSWSGDNGGTLVTANIHRGNLVDASGTGPDSQEPAMPHGRDAPPPAPLPTTIRPTFDRNSWDAWSGLDLDGDSYGDTPYLFDRELARRQGSQPWAGLFLGSPLTVLTAGLPGGEVLDPRPLVREPAPSSGLR